MGLPNDFIKYPLKFIHNPRPTILTTRYATSGPKCVLNDS